MQYFFLNQIKTRAKLKKKAKTIPSTYRVPYRNKMATMFQQS